MKILSNEIIKLRAVEPSDADLIYQWENNTDIWNVSNTLSPFSKHTIEMYVQSAHLDLFQTKQLRLMIDSVASGKTVGTLDMFDFDAFNLRAGVGILIADETDRNKGFAYNSLKVFSHYAFNVLQLNQLWANISKTNTSSIKLFEKLGFKHTGTKKQWIKTKNGFEDELFYQLFDN